MICLSIPGLPVGKGRPRITRNKIAYTPKQTRTQEAFIKALFVQKYPGHVILDGPLEMTVLAFFPIPKSASKSAKNSMILGGTFPTRKPDADNLLKVFMDALSGLAYRDDAQIVSVMLDKRYSENPHAEVKITAPGEEE